MPVPRPALQTGAAPERDQLAPRCFVWVGPVPTPRRHSSSSPPSPGQVPGSPTGLESTALADAALAPHAVRSAGRLAAGDPASPAPWPSCAHGLARRGDDGPQGRALWSAPWSCCGRGSAQRSACSDALTAGAAHRLCFEQVPGPIRAEDQVAGRVLVDLLQVVVPGHCGALARVWAATSSWRTWSASGCTSIATTWRSSV